MRGQGVTCIRGMAHVLALVLFIVQFAGCGSKKEGATAPAYVGAKVCAQCHAQEETLWSRSDHALAMQEANDETVLGDFQDATFTHDGITYKFFKKGGEFHVRAKGQDGKASDYEIAYTFGVAPLQQYLIPFPGGRYQPLRIAWDSRPTDRGGQRWFSLYPGQTIPPEDPLHWTGRNQTWNFMCADCHSTNLKKQYDRQQDGYATTWTDLNVSCEACHGPGSRHVEWGSITEAGRPSAGSSDGNGLTVDLRADRDAWVPNSATGIARRAKPLASDAEFQTCARCHARRSVIHEDYVHGKPLLDTHLPVLLEDRVYHADGQIKEEAYEYGSFLQSKMSRAGVTCSDCHEPHALTVRAEGNALCAQCHLPSKFDGPQHHFHKPDSTGGRCVECHMPARPYMVVDPRRDHSFRIPRPDLTVKLGTPNACTQCHRDRSPQWAAAKVTRWYGEGRRMEFHFGEAFHAARTRLPKADKGLIAIFNDPSHPGIARATALAELRAFPAPQVVAALAQGAANADPLVRIGALRGLQGMDPASRVSVASALLNDPIRAVRIEAARALAAVPRGVVSQEQQPALNLASVEYINAQLANAEMPGSHVNLGVFYAERGEWDNAEFAYRTALRLAPSFVPALINLADLYRLQNQDDKGMPFLDEALAKEPDNATAHHALGLMLVRQGRAEEALTHFEQASRLEPGDVRYRYVYGVALHSLGRTDRALGVLEGAETRHPGDPQVLQALATMHRDAGHYATAMRYAERLVALNPEDRAARNLMAELRAMRDR